MLSTIRVLVLEADPFVRNVIRWLLTYAPDFHLVGETANIVGLPNLCTETEAHVLLMGGETSHYLVKLLYFPRL